MAGEARAGGLAFLLPLPLGGVFCFLNQHGEWQVPELAETGNYLDGLFFHYLRGV